MIIVKMKSTILFAIILGDLASACNSFKPLTSKDEDLEICDRSTLNNITISYGIFLRSTVQKNFYSLKNESFIAVKHFDVSVLCEGMISDFPELNRLLFDYGNLMKIEPGTFQRVDKLTIISFEYNLLTTIQKGVFDPVKSLKEIYLNGNHISTIQQGAFSNMPNLSSIDLKINKITSLGGNIFNESPLLMDIDLCGNQIAKIDQNAFNDLKSVKGTKLEIDLSYNYIEHFDPRSLQDISTSIDLNLEFNKISDYTDIILNCKDRSLVNLKHNRISDIPDRLLDILTSRPLEVFLYGNDDSLCNITDRIEHIMDDEQKYKLSWHLHACPDH